MNHLTEHSLIFFVWCWTTRANYVLYLVPESQPFQNGWTWWFPTISYVKNWFIIQLKQPLINGCLRFQVYIIWVSTQKYQNSKMDGENNGKPNPMNKLDDLGGVKTPIFGKHPYRNIPGPCKECLGYTFPLGFNWHPGGEGAGILYIYIHIYIYMGSG